MNEVEEKIKNSDKIYKDILSYVEEILFNKNSTFYYFKNSDDVKNYLQENLKYIDKRLLNPSTELYFDLTSTTYYEHKDLDKQYQEIQKKVEKKYNSDEWKHRLRSSEARHKGKTWRLINGKRKWNLSTDMGRQKEENLE